jgi:rod shape-determining protein MreD
MKAWVYAGLAAGLVPVQTTLLGHLSVAGVRPDLCLIAASLIGFFGGPADGALMGALLGFEQDLFSAGDLGLNLGAKAAAGLATGLAGRYLAHVTVASVAPLMLGLSVCSGLAFMAAGAAGGDALAAVESVLLPQAVFDTVAGAALYWLLAERFRKDDSLVS